VFTLPESIGDEREIDEGDEHDIEFVESRADAPEALQAAEQPFQFGSDRLGGPRLRSKARHCGASPACPGESANVMAVRASAATI
jgi:hypothetical protein